MAVTIYIRSLLLNCHSGFHVSQGCVVQVLHIVPLGSGMARLVAIMFLCHHRGKMFCRTEMVPSVDGDDS